MIRPSPEQLRFLDWELGMFFHFGIRTFFPGHTDWDGTPMPASAFNPEALDCRQWIAAARELGCRYAILVCKHHDGFANWPSACTRYSVAASPWKDGRGDVVREFTDACREAGLGVGLYYSPAQWQGEVRFDDPSAYDDFFIRQLSELLTSYGKIDYLWFDGCGSDGHEYDQARIIAAIRSLQPGILIFNMWDPDVRWVGNENGYAPDPNPSEVESLELSVLHRDRETLGGRLFLPAECDMKLHDTWFYAGTPDPSLKSVEALAGCYEYSVGRGANLLINVAPDDRGLIPEASLARLRELRRELDRRYGSPLPFGEPERTDDTAVLTAQERTPVDAVILEEDIREGESVTAFRILAGIDAREPVTVFEGHTIGHKRICRFPTVMTKRLFVQITDARGDWRLARVRAYHTER